MRNAPVESTYCSNPCATHTVESLGRDSAGIQGYYTSEFDAHRVARYLKERGDTNVAVKEYNPKVDPGYRIHPLIELFHMECR